LDSVLLVDISLNKKDYQQQNDFLKPKDGNIQSILPENIVALKQDILHYCKFP